MCSELYGDWSLHNCPASRVSFGADILQEKTIFNPSVLAKWIKDKKAVFSKSLISYQKIIVFV